MTEFNSGRGGRDDDIVDLEAQPVSATGNSAEGSSLEPIKQEPLSGTVTVAHIVYCLHSISILIGLLTAGLSIAGAFVFSAPSILALKSSKAPTNYFTPNILRKSWSRLVVSVVHLDALAFPVAAT